MLSVLWFFHRRMETLIATVETRRYSTWDPVRMRRTLRNTENWKKSTTWKDSLPYLLRSTSMSPLELSWPPSECTNYSLRNLHVFEQTASSIDAKWLPRHRISMAYWLTPLSRVFLEKLTGFQLVKNFPAFYWTRRFITAFISARHLSLSWASSIQSRPPHPTSWRYILIFSYHLHLGLPSDLFPSVFPTKTLSPYALHAPPKLFFSLLSPEKYWVRSTDQ